MEKNRLAISEARDEFAEVANRVAYTKERVIVHRRGKDLVAVVPIEDLEALEALQGGPDVEALRHINELVKMDDESGRYAREIEEVRKAA